MDMFNGSLASQHSQSLSVFLFASEQVDISIMNYSWTSLEELTFWMPSSDCYSDATESTVQETQKVYWETALCNMWLDLFLLVTDSHLGF